jgi:hypothetical protein
MTNSILIFVILILIIDLFISGLIIRLQRDTQGLLDGQEGVGVDVVGQVDVWDVGPKLLFQMELYLPQVVIR